MQQSEMINKIITVEHEAAEMVRQAKEKQARVQEDISGEIEGLRTLYTIRANERIDLVETQERTVMEERIAALEEKSLRDIGHIERLYEQNREKWICKIFELITGADCGHD